MNNLIPSSTVKASPQYTALSHSHNQSSSSFSDTINNFCSPAEQALKANNSTVSDELLTTWQAILTYAANLHHHDSGRERTSLVEFLLEVKQRQSIEDKNGRLPDGMVMWKDLPLLGREVREAWNFTPNANSPAELKQRWSNLNAFIATLFASLHSKSNDNPDFSLFGLWTIRTALESGSQQQPSAADIEAACMWFLYSSAELHDLCRAGKEFQGKVARAGPGQEGKEWRGYSAERWQVWREQLQALEKRDGGDEEVRRSVRQALERIERAEKASA